MTKLRTFLITALLAALPAYSPAASLQAYEKACQAGNGAACGEIGARYCAPWGVIDCEKGKEYLKKSCDLNVANGCGALASIYEKGYGGTPKSPETALKYYEKACDLGSREYCYITGNRYKNGSTPAGANPAKALECFKKSCDAGMEDACRALNDLLDNSGI